MMPLMSEQILAAAAQTAVARDSTGREMIVRRPGAVDRLRMFKALGPELAQNTAYLGIAMLAVAVSAIDGVPVPAPGNELQLEALVQRLGNPGLAAVAAVLAAMPEADPGN